MKFTVNRTELLAAAQNAERIAPRVSTIEILQCAYLQAEQDTLTVASSNLEIALEQQIPAQIENEGSVVVKAPLLSGMLRLLDAQMDVGHNGAIQRMDALARPTLETLGLST